VQGCGYLSVEIVGLTGCGNTTTQELTIGPKATLSPIGAYVDFGHTWTPSLLSLSFNQARRGKGC
jgi:hypothetical protein